MPKPGQLLLVRHGQSEANAGLTTDPDSALTAVGWEQSRAVGRQIAAMDLRDFTALVSPYRRTRQTAQAITALSGIAFEVDERVREWGESAVVGEREYPSEPIMAVVARLREFLADRHERSLLIVSHATPIALLRQMARNEKLTTTGAFWEGVPNGCLIAVT